MADWHFKKPVDRFEPLEVLRFPFRLENLLVIALFSMIFSVATWYLMLPAGMGVRSVGIWFLAVVLLANYGFVIVEHTAHGLQHPPKLSGAIVFPASDPRFYLIAALTVVFLAGYYGTPAAYRGVYLILAFLTYPVFFATVVITHSVAAILNPVNLVKALVIFTASADSLRFFAIQLLLGAMLYMDLAHLDWHYGRHVLWAVPLTLVGFFLFFRALGVLMNTHAQALGIAIHQNAETFEAARAEEQARLLQAIQTEVHKFVAVHEYGQAWALLQDRAKGLSDDEVASLFLRFSSWDDKRIAVRLGLQLVERYLAANDHERAIRIFSTCYELTAGQLRTPSGETILQLARAARNLAHRQQVLAVLEHFPEDYPAHPRLPEALVLTATLLVRTGGDRKTAAALLRKARDADEQVVKSADFGALLRELQGPGPDQSR